MHDKKPSRLAALALKHPVASSLSATFLLLALAGALYFLLAEDPAFLNLPCAGDCAG